MRERTAAFLVVLVGAVCLACWAAQPFAGGWNDASRLATVECLIDHHTFAIDDSVFARTPGHASAHGPSPFDPRLPELDRSGTLDKLYINGRFYSDKSPVPAVLLAGWYQAWHWLTGQTAAEHPAAFCRAATLASSGLAFVVSLALLFLLACDLGQSPRRALAVTAAFAVATVAFPYAAHVNNHLLLLAVLFVVIWKVHRLGQAVAAGQEPSHRSWLALGFATGLGYAVDLGLGPVLVLATGSLVLWRARRFGPAAAFVLGALPWLALHHGINYAIAGTWKPANADPRYFQWPGSPFTTANMTGVLHHGPVDFLLHAGNMLGGKRGFLLHNLPLLLMLPALGFLLRRRIAERPEVLWAAATCAGVWLLYALASKNTAGCCLSIRWFVPLLAPTFYVVLLYLRDQPDRFADFAILSSWGTVLMAQVGCQPWLPGNVPHYWPIVGSAVASWGGLRLWLRLRQDASAAEADPSTPVPPASLTQHAPGQPLPADRKAA